MVYKVTVFELNYGDIDNRIKYEIGYIGAKLCNLKNTNLLFFLKIKKILLLPENSEI